MENQLTAAVANYRISRQEVIDRHARDRLDDARVEIRRRLLASPESMYEWLQDNVSTAEADALTGMALWLMLVQHYQKPITSLPVECFRFVAEEVGAVIEAAARKVVE